VNPETSNKFIKFVRIFLLVLIVIGVVLLLTQKIWVSKLVDKILTYQVFPIASEITPTHETKNYDWCIANGGKDRTPDFNAPKLCILEQRVYVENCISNDQYFVIPKDLMKSVGSDILVKYKSSPNQTISCEYLKGNTDFEIKNEWAEYLFAITNNFLILDSGTGPYPRGLIVYDLIKREKIYSDTYSEPIIVHDNTIDYWTEISEETTEKNCPKIKEYEAGGFGVAIDAHVSLNLSTLIKKELGERRCSPRQ